MWLRFEKLLVLGRELGFLLDKTFRATRKEIRNIRQMARLHRYLVQRKAVPKQGEYDIALEFTSVCCPCMTNSLLHSSSPHVFIAI